MLMVALRQAALEGAGGGGRPRLVFYDPVSLTPKNAGFPGSTGGFNENFTHSVNLRKNLSLSE